LGLQRLATAKALIRQLGIGLTSVCLSTSTFQNPRTKKPRSKHCLSVPEIPPKSWNEGCHEALVLFEEIQRQGYNGSYDTVARYARRIRHRLKPRQRYSIQVLPKVTQPKRLCLTPRRATWLILRQQDSQQPMMNN